jgi:hypothetical protein
MERGKRPVRSGTTAAERVYSPEKAVKDPLKPGAPTLSRRQGRRVDAYRLSRLGVCLLFDTDFVGKFDELP